MHIRYGYNIEFLCEVETPVIAMLDVHPTRRHDLTKPDGMVGSSLRDGNRIDVSRMYQDQFGNICRRILAPAGGMKLMSNGVIHDSGFADTQNPLADAAPPQYLPDDVLVYLLGSRYCETDRLTDIAWAKFGTVEGGWSKVRAVCDFVHEHIRFDYSLARATRTAAEGYEERVGVCRDFTHLAVTLCRCLNIPARYCTGYLGDIGVPADVNPMDFSAWFECYLDGAWWAFDARHNMPRIGRIVIAQGRDATDVPILNSFGAHVLQRFEVLTDEVLGARYPVSAQERRSHWDQWGDNDSQFSVAGT